MRKAQRTSRPGEEKNFVCWCLTKKDTEGIVLLLLILPYTAPQRQGEFRLLLQYQPVSRPPAPRVAHQFPPLEQTVAGGDGNTVCSLCVYVLLMVVIDFPVGKWCPSGSLTAETVASEKKKKSSA